MIAPSSPPPDLATYRRNRTVEDFYQRALPGSLFYAIACGITAWTGGYMAAYPMQITALLLAYVLLWVVRKVHRPPQTDGDAPAVARWRAHHWVTVHVGCALWGLFFLTVGVIEQTPTTAFLTAACATMAFTSAGCETYAFERRHALTVLVLLAAPGLLWLVYTAPALRSVVVVLMVFFVYQLGHIRRRAREYDEQMRIEYALITSRSEIERLSRQDVLTGLANRRAYEQVFELHWNLAARQKGALSLIILDLDFFKSINDQWGHAAGDACLKHASDLLTTHFRRARDTVARIGGEEFAVVLPDTAEQEALLLAQAFGTALAHTPAVYAGQTIAITASIGVGQVRWDTDTTPEMSFSRIDAACYAAKSQGRNRVMLTN